LKSRPDRYQVAANSFADLGIKESEVNWFQPDKDRSNPERGCFTSHQTVIKQAYLDGHQYVLVFEDDFGLARSSTELQEIIPQIDQLLSDGFDYLALGGIPNTERRIDRVSRDIYRVETMAAQAYIINCQRYHHFLEMEYRGIPVDKLLGKGDHAYAVYPILFYQKPSDSDVNQNTLYHHIDYAGFFNVPWFYWTNVGLTYLEREILLVVVVIAAIIFLILAKQWIGLALIVLLFCYLTIGLIFCASLQEAKRIAPLNPPIP